MTARELFAAQDNQRVLYNKRALSTRGPGLSGRQGVIVSWRTRDTGQEKECCIHPAKEKKRATRKNGHRWPCTSNNKAGGKSIIAGQASHLQQQTEVRGLSRLNATHDGSYGLRDTPPPRILLLLGSSSVATVPGSRLLLEVLGRDVMNDFVYSR